jgi:STE24 endopeptidase
MASEGLVADTSTSSLPSPGSAKTYNRSKLVAGIVSSILSFALLLVLVLSGLTRDIEAWSRSLIGGEYGTLLVFAFAIGLVQSAITLPIGYYSGYILEHRYHLSNQTIGRWAWERLKGTGISLPLVAALLALLYACLIEYGMLWWLPVSCAITLLSVVLARLAPVLIMPLFYKFTPVSDGPLKERILRLCGNAGLQIRGIFTFNLSKNTKKANAGFTGIGKSKRIILGDTLVREFSEEEIETVFAHELGHYKHKHITIGIITGIVSTFGGLFIAAQAYGWSVGILGFSSITEIAALPLLALWLTLFGLVTSPLGNMLSRRHERQADVYAVTSTGNARAFVSALNKLAATNLADPSPHPLVEFLFYSHPSIGRRVHAVESIGV